jgi:hypothetical protein
MKQTLRDLIVDGKTKQALDQLRQLDLAGADLAAEGITHKDMLRMKAEIEKW